ncbi:MAG: hypothetical protein A3F14_05750 [Gammaproteobacteria bacterium RIFCSPHIGHO2_12_FULL_43_28]|nr:MAG: hypothetical protein A3F14_05750 [Gammaproteobacteria bacterium RIFCSPHIGHO2_12_FULL_43_28]
MRQITNQTLYIFLITTAILLVYLLAPILTPFLLGSLLAYLSAPLVKRLEKWHVPHILSVAIILFTFIATLGILLLLIIPTIHTQILALIEAAPKIQLWFETNVLPKFQEFISLNDIERNLPSTLKNAGWLFGTVLSSGYTMLEWLVNIVLTIIVTAYLLRDWDTILAGIKRAIPDSARPTMLSFMNECLSVLGAFFRGQLLVMLALGCIYGIGLTLIGLRAGLLIGLLGGLLSIVPFLGSTFVVVTSCIMALVQFGDWHALTSVFIVFLIGQALEGYVLTPYLVGGRLGLHPVAVIFAVMAGGTLFGFFGILLALPAAAVFMVFARFARQQYTFGPG